MATVTAFDAKTRFGELLDRAAHAPRQGRGKAVRRVGRSTAKTSSRAKVRTRAKP